jgi:hypothetical protein
MKKMDSETQKEFRRIENMGPGLFLKQGIVAAILIYGLAHVMTNEPGLWAALRKEVGGMFAIWLVIVVPFAAVLEWANIEWKAAWAKRRAFYEAHGLEFRQDPAKNDLWADAYLTVGRYTWVGFTIYVWVDKTITWERVGYLIREWARQQGAG